nr:hypothetical protein [Sicyoidochytrium minutum DNA virus]
MKMYVIFCAFVLVTFSG